MLNQALSEFAHTEHLDPNFVESVDQSIANKKSNPGSIDPVIFCFSSSLPNSQDDNVSKYVELLKTRYIKSISQIFCARATDFWRFHRFIAPHAAKSPEIFEFLCLLAQNASEKDPQTLAVLFMKNVFNIYSPYLSNRALLPHIVSLIFAHTEADESARDSRVPQILECCPDEETQFVILSNTVMQERIFSAKLCELYSGYVERGLDNQRFQPYAIHILRYLAPINNELLQKYMDRIGSLVNDERPEMQTALVQLLVEANQEALLTKLIENTKRLDVLSLSLHLVSELGQIPSALLIQLFQKIGTDNIEKVCTDRCTVQSPVGPLQLGRLTKTWNSAAVNSTVIQHIKNLPLQQWDVEFALCKLLLRQPMDSTSAQIWQQLFTQLTPQIGEFTRDEEMTDVIFDIVGFYLIATLDIDLFERLQSLLEPVVTVAKEKCKSACTRFLTRMAELGPRFKQIVNNLILV